MVVKPWLRCGGVAKQGSGGHGDGPKEDLMDAAVYVTGRWGCPGRWELGHLGGRRLVLLQSGVSRSNSEPVHHRVPAVLFPRAFL